MSCVTLYPVNFLSLLWQVCPHCLEVTLHNIPIGVCVCDAGMLFREEWIHALSPIKSNQRGGESLVLIQPESEPIREKRGCCRLTTLRLNPFVSDAHKHAHRNNKWWIQWERPSATNSERVYMLHDACLLWRGLYIYTLHICKAYETSFHKRKRSLRPYR